MREATAFAIRAASAGALVALCNGCPDPNIYGTPRTTPAGKVSHTLATQGTHYSFDNTQAVDGEASNAFTPLPPTYQLRIGVVDRLDVGIRVAHLTTLGADVKWNFIKTDAFDMAINPGVQAWWYSCSTNGRSHGQVYGNLPLLFGINASDSISIVPTVGVSYGCSSRAILFDATTSDADHVDGLMLRAGFGLDFRISPKFALHPELTYLEYVGSDSEPAVSWIMFGIGLNFGALPQPGGGI